MQASLRLSFALALAALSTHAVRAASGLTPDQEVVPPTEMADTQRLAKLIEAGVRRAYAAGQRPSRRDAHNKGHGCVRARFEIDPTLPDTLRRGVFAQLTGYEAWIRLSNSSNESQDDAVGDGRGFAIKLLGVRGKKVLPEEADDPTQDFLMISLPTFFIPNVADYLGFVLAVQQGKVAAFFKAHPLKGATQKAMNDVPVGDMLETKFYSMSPYLLGDRYVKFAALPIDCVTGAEVAGGPPSPKTKDPDFLRERMVADLSRRDACFAFELQPQTNPATQPIENTTVLWKESEAPFVRAAKITIPKQTFDTPAQQTFCENLSFTPWHALPEERPVGGINRLRRVVYEVISTTRHALNNAPRVEPTDTRTAK